MPLKAIEISEDGLPIFKKPTQDSSVKELEAPVFQKKKDGGATLAGLLSPSSSLKSGSPSKSVPKRLTPAEFLAQDVETNDFFSKLDAETRKYMPQLAPMVSDDVQAIKQQTTAAILSNPQQLAKYNKDRTQALKDKVKGLETQQRSYASETKPGIGTFASLRIDNPAQYASTQKDIDETNLYLSQLKGNTADVAADLVSAQYDITNYNPREIGRKIVEIADPNLHEQLNMVEKAGLAVPNMKTAEMELVGMQAMEQFLSKQEDSPQKQQMLDRIQMDKADFDERNPSIAAQRVREKLGARIYKGDLEYTDNTGIRRGITGTAFGFGYTPEELKVVAEDPATGLTETEKKIFYSNVLPVETKIIGTNIPTSGFTRSFNNAIEKSAISTGKSIASVTGLRSEAEQAQEGLNQEEEGSRFRSAGENPTAMAQLQYLKSQPVLTEPEKKYKKELENYVGVRNNWSKFKDGVGDLTGQVVEIAFLTKGIGSGGKLLLQSGAEGGLLGGVTRSAVGSLLSNETTGLILSGYLNSYDNYKQQAIQLMPGEQNEAKREQYAQFMAAVEGATELIFRDTKVFRAFITNIAPSVREITQRLVNGEITQQAAREAVNATVRDKLKVYGKQYVKASGQEGLEESAVDVLEAGAQAVVFDKNFDKAQVGQKALNTFLTTMLYSPLVSGMSAHGSYRQNQSQNAFAKSAILNMAVNPAAYLQEVENLQLEGVITPTEAAEKVKLINSSQQYLNELPPTRSVSVKGVDGVTTEQQVPFDYPQVTNYLVHRLNEGIIEERLNHTTDPVQQSVLNKELKRSQEIRKGIYNGSIGVTPNIESVTNDPEVAEELGIADAALLPNSDLIGTPFNPEAAVETPSTKEYNITPDQTTEATQFVNELIEAGTLNDTEANWAQQDPVGFLQEIASQANIINAAGEQNETFSPEASVRELYGDTVVDYAKELFPAPLPEYKLTMEKGGILKGDLVEGKELIAEGSESHVYRDGDTVVKVSEPYNDPSTYDNRVADATLINQALGDGSLEVIGWYASPNGTKNPIFRQAFLEGEKATPEQIEEYMKSKGFEKTGANTFQGEFDGKQYQFSDLDSDNVLIQPDGNIVVIDAGVKEVTPVKTAEAATPEETKIKDEPTEEGATTEEEGAKASETPPDSEGGDNAGASGAKSEGGEGSGITHARTAETRAKAGLKEYEKTRKSDKELKEEAQQAIKDGYDIDALIQRMERGHDPSDLETTILKIRLAELEEEIEADPTNEKIDDLDRLTKASDTAGSRQGRALRSRRDLDIDPETMAGALVREKRALGVSELSQEDIDFVKKQYEQVKDILNKLEKRNFELEKEAAELRAQQVVNEQKKKATKSSPKTKGDYVKDRQQILAEAAAKLKAIRDGGTTEQLPSENEEEISPVGSNDKMVNDGDSIGDILRRISEANLGDYSDIASRLLEISDGESLGVKIVLHEQDKNGQRAFYTLETDTITFIGDNKDDIRTILHEAIHAMTAKKIPRKMVHMENKGKGYLETIKTHQPDWNNKGARQIIDLYEQAVKAAGLEELYFGDNGIANDYKAYENSKNPNKVYGLVNLDEFLSESFTNGAFQRKLTEWHTTKKQSLWEVFVEMIRELFGFENDAVRKVLKAGEKIISAQRGQMVGRKGRLFAEGGYDTHYSDLIVIAPEVNKVVRSIIDESIQKGEDISLDEIVSTVHKQFSDILPDITEKDVHDIIAGDYGEPRMPISELNRKLKDLRTEADLINQLEKLLNGEKPKTQEKQRNQNRKIQELREKIKDFKDEEAQIRREEKEREREAEREERKLLKEEERAARKAQREAEREANKKSPADQALARIKGRLNKQIEDLSDDLVTGNFSEPKTKTQITLDKETQALKDQLAKLRMEREVRLIKLEYEKRNKFQKGMDAAANILNIPRTLMATLDFSAPLRQAAILTVANPGQAAKSGLEMFRQAFSEKRFNRWFAELKESDRYRLMEESGLYIADPTDPRISAREEEFMSNLVQKVPFIGQVVAGSERAYVSYLNKMRVDLFNRYTDAFQKEGFTFENSEDLYKGLASFLNNATGRGNLGALEAAAPILNSAFFSPRLIASRMNILGIGDAAAALGGKSGYYAKLPPKIRKMALIDLGIFVGVGITTLALLALAFGCDGEDDKDCLKVEVDPRSSDFGKVRHGQTRWDIWAGFQPYVRVIAQLATGQTKSTNGDTVRELNGEDAFGRTRGDVVFSFFRGKLAPVPSLVVDYLEGKTAVGEKFQWGGWDGAIATRLLPITAKDLVESVNDNGVKTIFTQGIPGIFGVGVQNYKPRGYDKEELKDPTFKFLYDKNLNLSTPPKKDMTDEQYQEFIPLQKKYVQEQWEEAIQYGILINEKGNPTIDEDAGVELVTATKATHEQLTGLMKSISSKATRDAKKELDIEQE